MQDFSQKPQTLDAFGTSVSAEPLRSVWVEFEKDGKKYVVVFVFNSPGPYMLLTSNDKKDVASLQQVANDLTTVFEAETMDRMTPRSDDICTVIRQPSGFTRDGIVRGLKSLGERGYSEFTVVRSFVEEAEEAEED